MEESLTNSKAEILKFRSALSKCEDKVNLLDHQLEDVTTKFSEEVRLRDESLTNQSSELESKANTIAMLTQQLYNTKIRLRNEIQAKTALTASHATSNTMCVCPHCHVHRKQAIVTGSTGDVHYVIHEAGGGVVEQVPSPSTVTRSRISRIQRRHFRNSSSPAAQEVGSLYDSEGQNMPNKTGTHQRLPTPPLTPRPPSTTSQAPPTMIRRASKTVRKQSPSPRSSKGHIEVGGGSSKIVSHVPSLTEIDTSNDGGGGVESCSAASISNEKKILDPVQTHRQGVMPDELRELLQSRGSESGGMQIISSKPAPLPPIAGEDTASRLKGHPPPHQHRHFILAKAQGLSSAPSTVRVLRYPPPSRQGEEGVATRGLLEPGEIKDDNRVTMEGTLLVKETTDRNDSTLQELH